MRGLALSFFFVCCLAAGCGCDPEAIVRSLTPAGARDCGRAAALSDPGAVNACVETVLREKQPFRAQYDQRGVDSQVVYYYVGDTSGRVAAVHYDSDITGGTGKSPRVSQSDCVGPAVTEVDGRRELRCASLLGTLTACGKP